MSEQFAHIRWLIRRDMKEVLAIEKDSFEFAWEEEDFLNALQQRNVIGMVAVDSHKHRTNQNDEMLGYVLYELHKTHLHIINFAVKKDSRRLRVGCQMMEKLISKMSKQRRNMISAYITESNDDAHLFFRQMGFHATHVMHNFYDDHNEDAYKFEYHHRPLKSEFLPVNRFTKKVEDTDG